MSNAFSLHPLLTGWWEEDGAISAAIYPPGLAVQTCELHRISFLWTKPVRSRSSPGTHPPGVWLFRKQIPPASTTISSSYSSIRPGQILFWLFLISKGGLNLIFLVQFLQRTGARTNQEAFFNFITQTRWSLYCIKLWCQSWKIKPVSKHEN